MICDATQLIRQHRHAIFLGEQHEVARAQHIVGIVADKLLFERFDLHGERLALRLSPCNDLLYILTSEDGLPRFAVEIPEFVVVTRPPTEEIGQPLVEGTAFHGLSVGVKLQQQRTALQDHRHQYVVAHIHLGHHNAIAASAETKTPVHHLTRIDRLVVSAGSVHLRHAQIQSLPVETRQRRVAVDGVLRAATGEQGEQSENTE